MMLMVLDSAADAFSGRGLERERGGGGGTSVPFGGLREVERKEKEGVDHAKLDVRLTKPKRDEFSGNYNTAPASPVPWLWK